MALFELINRPPLDSPVLVIQLEGYIDAGGAAGAAARVILGDELSEPVASFDTEPLLDFRARRPVMHLVDGVNTGLTWPAIDMHHRRDLDGRDALLLVGPEPDHLWPSFARSVIDLALELDTWLVVGLGAYPAAAPHTRPPHLSATATSQDLASQIGFVNSTLDIPAGIHAVIERECADHGIPAIGLWAQVPHYASQMSYPASAVALLDGLRLLTSLRFDLDELRHQATSVQLKLDELVRGNDEHQQMIRQLELHDDVIRGAGTNDLPTGDDIAAEVERFLRQQDD